MCNKYKLSVETDSCGYGIGSFKYGLQAYLTKALFIEKEGLGVEYNLPNKHQKEIIKWGSERLLFNYSKDTEKRLIDEELRELKDAKTEHEKIDALCDCYVVLTQTFAKAGLAGVKIENDEWLQEMYRFHNEIPDKIKELGYNFECAINETIKEISSRVGKIGEDGKWYKNTSEEARKRWYKSDYSKCKF